MQQVILQAKEIPAESAAWAKEFEEAAEHSRAHGYEDIWKHYGEVCFPWSRLFPAVLHSSLGLIQGLEDGKASAAHDTCSKGSSVVAMSLVKASVLL